MKKGKLIYDSCLQQMCIMLPLEGGEVLGGLHCGACLDVYIGGCWLSTRLERIASSNDFYLEGISKEIKLAGLPVRI
jgi:hypothetical protein